MTLSIQLERLAGFQWNHAEIANREDLLLLRDTAWWERREETVERANVLAARADTDQWHNGPLSEFWFALALAVICTGSIEEAQPYLQRLESTDPDPVLTQWMALELQGRRRQYAAQAATIARIAKLHASLPNWAITACLMSLSHNGIDPQPLLKVLPPELSSTNPLLVTLRARLLGAAGRTDLALLHLESARKKWPDQQHLAWFQGNLLAQLGRYAQARQSYESAIAEPDRAVVDMPMIRYWLSGEVSTPFIGKEEAPVLSIYRRLAPLLTADFRQSAELATFALIQYWMDGNYEACHGLLSRYYTYQDLPKSESDHSGQVFMRFLIGLLIYWQYNKRLYSSERRSENIQTLYVLGESHSLSSANVYFTWRGMVVRARSCFVMGSKMYHLGRKSESHWKSRTLEHIATLPEYAHVLVTIGEIDCRSDEGIWHSHIKSGRKIAHLVKITVNDYLDFLELQLGSRKLNSITIQGVPAPGYSLNKKINEADIPKFLNMIQQVNENLKTGVLRKGWAFLDVYSATKDENGLGNQQWHIDGYHLQPGFYSQAEKWLVQL